ncbi:hypothetical protein E2F43_13495 [Seongchinamella unica]|uniref:Uncharacterized protein n=1 Tax=Seongchinamella unica TaxID=2547392 RepID=A0A4R5LQ21_9GAMM|nr:GDCCVxC domain-containing (seleno)protein [Seongchinamella unica]TDG12601.1 hypothetical protein E2F43_13495 [Seongchinamella unica]
MKQVILESTITCPECSHQKSEVMPTDSCLFFYECEGCKKLLKPNPGDCCVFCSFGSVQCPPVQQGKNCIG